MTEVGKKRLRLVKPSMNWQVVFGLAAESLSAALCMMPQLEFLGFVIHVRKVPAVCVDNLARHRIDDDRASSTVPVSLSHPHPGGPELKNIH